MKTSQNPQTGIDRANLLGRIARAQLREADTKHREVMMEGKYIDLLVKYSELKDKYEELCAEMYGEECKKSVRNSVLLPSGTRIIEFNPVYKVAK
jgi:hypothetical protein